MKRMFWKVAAVAALVVTGAGVAGVAAASSDGSVGHILLLQVSTPSMSSYPYVHSTINIGGTWYYSGGSYCQGVEELSPSQLEMLTVLLAHEKRINPWYEVVGDKKCISGFQAYADL